MNRYKIRHSTPLGDVEIVGTAAAINAVCCVEGSDIKPNSEILLKESAFTDAPPEILERCAAQLDEYFAGGRTRFDIPLALQGTPFEMRVWQALLRIPFGTTVSYSELTASLGDMKALRAVAAANGRNPVWIIVPCHRVIGKNGDLVGYAGGLWRKERLLKHEGALPQSSLF